MSLGDGLQPSNNPPGYECVPILQDFDYSQLPPNLGFDPLPPEVGLKNPQAFGAFPGNSMPSREFSSPRYESGFSGTCFRCGKIGHMSKSCPSTNSGFRFRGACRRCGEEGHFAKECPLNGGDFGQLRQPMANTQGQTMNVDSEDVGRIIGKGGSKIRQLENDSGCRIKILREMCPPQVHLLGSQVQCDLARKMIQGLTFSERRRPNPRNFFYEGVQPEQHPVW